MSISLAIVTALNMSTLRNRLRSTGRDQGLPIDRFRAPRGASSRFCHFGPDPLARPGMTALIHRPPARNIEHRAGRERAILRRQPRDQDGELLAMDETVPRGFLQHLVHS